MADRKTPGSENIHRQASNPLPWYQQTNLRWLYLKMVILFLASTSLGYDASLLNGLQTMDTWAACMFESHQRPKYRY